ncbi:MAG: hypothetical protein F9K16_03645 [Thermoanaerobaculia bacterium]|nr:MAG: hypothetical protein F9K16_03645 [Thermoanaerobaculia bacterium]
MFRRLAALAGVGLFALAVPVGGAIGLDLTYIDTGSPAWQRFVAWVDQALDGTPPYGFTATDAVYVYRVTDDPVYAQLAIDTVEEQVTAAEAAISLGQAPPVAGDQYLESGPFIHDVALVRAWCFDLLTPTQRQRWAAYAEQTVWNIWHHQTASWGGVPHPWPGWGTDDPGNNYYFSFLEATMYWALASENPVWMDLLEDEKLPPLVAYFAALPGGGTREGTGYGVAIMRVFELYRLWRDSTGSDLGAASSHLTDTIDYWIHATVPTFDRYAPVGDLARESYPWLYDYHRRLVLEARAVSTSAAARARAAWWLDRISIGEMTGGFNYRHDLLPASGAQQAPGAYFHRATGAGHLFARTDWSAEAVWMSLVAGTFDQSHAHQDQGAFNLFRGDFLAVTENVFSHSGIVQESEHHNLVRFVRAGATLPQRRDTTSTMTAGRVGGRLRVDADLSPAWQPVDGVHAWTRRLWLDGNGLLVLDQFDVDGDVEAVFQVNVPVEPVIAGGVASAGDLTVVPILPADAVLSVVDWQAVDPSEYTGGGFKIEIRGSGDRFAVRLQLPHVLFVDGFETGGIEAWELGTR